MLIKVIAVQAQLGKQLSLEEKIYIFKERPDFVCLPEYYLLDKSLSDFHRAALRRSEFLDYYQRLSDELSTCIVGGTVVEAESDELFNVCYVFNRGETVTFYRKQHPVDGERRNGISPGNVSIEFTVEGVKAGILICGDVFYPETYDDLGRLEVDIIFVPTTSPYRADDSVSRKAERDKKYFLEGAMSSGAYVVKTCGVGTLFGKRLQGRSLIAAPWGLLAALNSSDEFERRIITETLDIAEIREFRIRLRSKSSGFCSGSSERVSAES